MKLTSQQMLKAADIATRQMMDDFNNKRKMKPVKDYMQKAIANVTRNADGTKVQPIVKRKPK